MEWWVVTPRLRRLLHPSGVVALLGGKSIGEASRRHEVLPVIQRYSTNRDFQPYHTVADQPRPL